MRRFHPQPLNGPAASRPRTQSGSDIRAYEFFAVRACSHIPSPEPELHYPEPRSRAVRPRRRSVFGMALRMKSTNVRTAKGI
jgi:hypothetical protein